MASSAKVIDTLAWIREQDFKPIPLVFKSKAIHTEKTNNLNLNEQTIADDLWHNQNAAPLNIGVITGIQTNGPLDVDLDCSEAAALAPYFLPSGSVIFGRKSRPNSHYLYVPTALKDKDGKLILRADKSIPNFQILDPTPETFMQGKPLILEFTGDNKQAMMPGSIHPEGEEINWYGDKRSFNPIDPKLLTKACKLLGAAVLASRYIWTEGQRHESVLQISGIFYRLKYSLADAENFINALMRYNDDIDRAHLISVQSTYRKLDADNPAKGLTSLRERFKDSNPKMVTTFLQLLGYSKAWLDSLNERYACVTIGAKYKVVILPRKANVAHTYISIDDFKHRTAGEMVDIITKPEQKSTVNGKEIIEPAQVKRLPSAELWLKSLERKQYEEVEFLPGTDQANMSPDVLNEWTGWAVQPENNAEKCKAFRAYVEQYLTNPQKPEQAQWVYTFFANILRDPADKQRAALVIIGPQKIGKSVFVNYFGSILGRYHLNLADANKIHGRFNYHLKNCLLLHSEEAVFGGDKKHRAIIKDFIANKSGEYEEKYMGLVHAKSYGRLIYTSNEERAAPIELGDTRHTIFNFNVSKRLPPAELVQELYYEAISEEGPRALMHFLQTYEPYDKALMGVALATAEKELTLAQNMDNVDTYWWNKLKTGYLLEKRLRWAQGSLKTSDLANEAEVWPRCVSRTVIYADYLRQCNEIRTKPVSSYRFFKRLSDWIDSKLEFKYVQYLNPFGGDIGATIFYRDMYTGQHQAVSNMPTLAQCRKLFAKYAGQDFEWENLIIEEDSPNPAITEEMPPF